MMLLDQTVGSRLIRRSPHMLQLDGRDWLEGPQIGDRLAPLHSGDPSIATLVSNMHGYLPIL